MTATQVARVSAEPPASLATGLLPVWTLRAGGIHICAERGLMRACQTLQEGLR